LRSAGYPVCPSGPAHSFSRCSHPGERARAERYRGSFGAPCRVAFSPA